MSNSILQHIPFGKDNAISREDLELKTNSKDRDNRIAIHNLKKKGVPILSLRKGYFIPTKEEAHLKTEYIDRERKRIFNELEVLNKLEKTDLETFSFEEVV